MACQSNTSRRRSGFSLIELVIVVVIIGIIAAIAIPRMSRGSAGAADAAVQQNLSLLRNAIDMYQQEHNGALPTAASFGDQLTKYSDINGNVSPTNTKDSTYYLGPYMRSIPAITVGDNKGKNGVSAPGTPDGNTAWLYNATAGTISPHTPGATTDSSGRDYSSY